MNEKSNLIQCLMRIFCVQRSKTGGLSNVVQHGISDRNKLRFLIGRIEAEIIVLQNR